MSEQSELPREEYPEEINELLAEIELGSACYNFLLTDLGRYLISKALDEEEAAFKEWQLIDETDAKAIRACQQKAIIPKLVIAWLQDAVKLGSAATQQLETTMAEDEQNG